MKKQFSRSSVTTKKVFIDPNGDTNTSLPLYQDCKMEMKQVNIAKHKKYILYNNIFKTEEDGKKGSFNARICMLPHAF